MKNYFQKNKPLPRKQCGTHPSTRRTDGLTLPEASRFASATGQVAKVVCVATCPVGNLLSFRVRHSRSPWGWCGVYYPQTAEFPSKNAGILRANNKKGIVWLVLAGVLFQLASPLSVLAQTTESDAQTTNPTGCKGLDCPGNALDPAKIAAEQKSALDYVNATKEADRATIREETGLTDAELRAIYEQNPQPVTGLLDPETGQPISYETPAEPEGQIYDANAGKYVPIEQAQKEAEAAQKTAPGVSPASEPASEGDLNGKDICSSIVWEFRLCVGYALFRTGNWFVGISGPFLNYAIEVSIVKMSTVVKSIGAINVAWKTFRDLANVFFIFILIYIAIKTILGLSEGETRRMLVNVILVALFINFSLFFTKVVIDASNIVTVQFYNSITKGDSLPKNGLSQVFLNGSRMTTIFKAADDPALYKGVNYILIGLASLIFGIILSFCFLAIGILFLIRLVVLMAAMILSPLAFLGHTVPQLKQAWDMYWKTLTNQAIFAPFMMAMLWLIALIINHPGFVNSMLPGRNADFTALVGSRAASAVPVVVNFAILIILLMVGMIISKQFGSYGSGAVIGAFDKWSRRAVGGMTFGAAGAAFRGTVGQAASGFARTDKMKEWAASNIFGAGLLKGTRGIAKSSFDVRATDMGKGFGVGEAGGKGGYQGMLDKQVKERTEFAKSLGKETKVRDKETNELVEKHQKDKDMAQKNLDDINKQIAERVKAGANEEEMAPLNTQKLAIMKRRDAAARAIEEIDKNPELTRTAEEAYAERIKSETWGKFGDIETLWTKIARKNKEAAKKVQEQYKKEQAKRERDWKTSQQKKEAGRLRQELEPLQRNIREAGRREDELTSSGRSLDPEQLGELEMSRTNIEKWEKEAKRLQGEIGRNEQEVSEAEEERRIEKQAEAVANKTKEQSSAEAAGKKEEEKSKEGVEKINKL